MDYQGVNIDEAIRPDIKSFSYTDNASGEFDDISIKLKDDHRRWSTDWFPQKGDIIDASLIAENWTKNGDRKRLPCGRFFVDEPKFSGPPREVSIDAIGAPLNNNFTDRERSKTWRNTTLRDIASEISSRSELTLQYIGDENPSLDEIEQSEEPDYSFLANLCDEEAKAIKVTDQKIIIFDEQEFEQRDAVDTYRESADRVLDYSFDTSLTNTAYDAVEISYYDPKKGENIQHLYAITDITEDSKVFKMSSKVSTGEDARRIAQKKLRTLNKREITGSITILGNPELAAGACIILQDFGVFDGKAFIEKITHDLPGYRNNVEFRLV
ncbi:phage late control D family protein [Salibacterium halotolerans]|uniref:phage late control D family protein n=1 Tax=Salibacterium halotolerans TaxID=1884432 RepID=UPI00147B5127|nr:contractile injection system protein, VgrG/Pvc8 family [Salibacterium halotolerans]